MGKGRQGFVYCAATRRISEARSYDQLATTVSKKTIFEEKRVSEQKKCLGNA